MERFVVNPRAVLAALLAAAFLAGAALPAVACNKRTPTPPTGPGPHDYTHAASTEKLWNEGDPGEPLFLKARVLDTCGKPVPNAKVRILHANQDGYHEHDRWRTHLFTDERGALRLITVFPGYTGGIPRHMHFIIEHPDHPQLVTRLFFKNDPAVKQGMAQGIEDLAMVLEEVDRKGKKAWLATYEFILGLRAK